MNKKARDYSIHVRHKLNLEINKGSRVWTTKQIQKINLKEPQTESRTDSNNNSRCLNFISFSIIYLSLGEKICMSRNTLKHTTYKF